MNLSTKQLVRRQDRLQDFATRWQKIEQHRRREFNTQQYLLLRDLDFTDREANAILGISVSMAVPAVMWLSEADDIGFNLGYLRHMARVIQNSPTPYSTFLRQCRYYGVPAPKEVTWTLRMLQFMAIVEHVLMKCPEVLYI